VNWLRNFGWALLAITTFAIAAAPDVLTLPKPEAAIVLDRALYQPDGGIATEVALPHAVFPQISRTPNIVRYVIGFDLPSVPDKSTFVFVPSINRRIALEFNGEPFLGFESSALWTGPLVSVPVMARLPRRGVLVGHNELTVVVESGSFAIPTYLSPIYLGTEAALAPNFKLRNFLDSQLKSMVFAAHLLLGLGLVFAYFFRSKDPLFSWLAVLNITSGIIAIGMSAGYQPTLHALLPFIVILYPCVGILLVGIALALINVQPPTALRLLVVAMPVVMLPLAIFDTTLTKLIAAASVTAFMTLGIVAATGLTAWGAFRQRNTDARVMLAPTFLIAWLLLRDLYITATLPEHGFSLLVSYPKPLWLACLIAVLMRRMGVSLDQFDRANETLNIKLAEREAELAVLHRQERAKTVSSVREHERLRLTHDLHDGLSGHLVSIIALSERTGDRPTEQAAREALNDLRLVIYSLDLGDRELPLALANFRERLIPQLHRLGVELDWSIAALPEVSGVTPGNALAVLRILQEAITNALKHGPARKISVRGGVAADGKVAIAVENEGVPFVETQRGLGLANMRKRAEQLHGSLALEALSRGTRLVLLLPARLPDFEEPAVT
jgi:two-component system sensor histidine kinase UhpB